MTTLQISPVWTEVKDAEQLPLKAIGYFRARIKNRLHQLILSEFIKKEELEGFTRAALAKRIHKRPEQITRLLGAPGNWTLDTVSDLLLAMGYELEPSKSSLGNSDNTPTISASLHTGPVNQSMQVTASVSASEKPTEKVASVA